MDFKNTIVIMNSNLGSPIIQEYFSSAERGMRNAESKNSALRTPNSALAKMEQAVLADLKRHFRPEFLNLVDVMIIFQSLDESELARIVDIQLVQLEKRLARQNLTLDVDAGAKRLLASEGYDLQSGARPLKRAIQEHLLDPLAMKLLAGEFKPGEKITVTAKDDKLAFQRKS